MRRKTIILLLATVVAGSVLVLAPTSLAAPSETDAPDEATTTTAEAGETTAAAALPLCTTTVKHDRVMTVPAAGKNKKNRKSCWIGDGSVGCSNCAAIRTLQNALLACNEAAKVVNPRNFVDGKWGPDTKKALEHAQNKRGVKDDGFYGPTTRNKLLWPAGSSDGQSGCAGYFSFR